FYKMEHSKENMFVTGKAGSGKTTLLEYFRINSSKNFIILASTGISAIKAKGKTIHSFFLFPPRILINEKIQKLRGKVINNVETILIDECSMIRSDVLDGIDQSLKFNRNNEKPFGAQVMLIKNDTKSPKRWVNGSIGVVTELSRDSIKLRIKNKIHKITQDTWEKFNYRIQDNQVVHEVTATFTQYPIKLAWAVTIHKSQGQTFENVILNLDTGSFAHGQTYVALSRVVSLEGLYLTRRIKMSDVIFNQNLQEYLV
ncbi:hypothetical protein N8Z57_02645, partial [Pseudomonadota bacterium]|nr:hypothetical protein [Pseudomonadota bacterium]